MFAETVQKLDEVFDSVVDLSNRRAFYKDILGFEEEFHDGDGALDSEQAEPR